MRGASQSVASEVKKIIIIIMIKTVNDIRWRFEGNKLQHGFNSKQEDSLTQTLLAF